MFYTHCDCTFICCWCWWAEQLHNIFIYGLRHFAAGISCAAKAVYRNGSACSVYRWLGWCRVCLVLYSQRDDCKHQGQKDGERVSHATTMFEYKCTKAQCWPALVCCAMEHNVWITCFWYANSNEEFFGVDFGNRHYILNLGYTLRTTIFHLVVLHFNLSLTKVYLRFYATCQRGGVEMLVQQTNRRFNFNNPLLIGVYVLSKCGVRVKLLSFLAA